MIDTYSNRTAYNEAGLPDSESRVALITADNEVRVDGINVITKVPRLGDAVYINEYDEVVIIAKDTLKASLVPAGWTYKGPVLHCTADDTVAVLYGNVDSLPTKKYADVVQFAITAISATSITFFLKMAGDYANFVQIDVTLTSAEINATSAAEIAAAIEAAGNTGNVGYDKHKYWAYLADVDGNQVESDGTQIIVQCDNWLDYRQYQCSDSTHALAGCTMTLSVWGDMPTNSALWRNNGISSYFGGLEFDGFKAYYSANGKTPTADVPLNAADPVNETSFNTSQYCALLRSNYGTYDAYMRSNMVRWPQKYGVFKLPDGKTLTDKYGPMTAPVKDGTTKAKFPALNWAYELGGYLWGVSEGTIMMDDDNLAAINKTQTAVGKVNISAASSRWFAQRFTASAAWFFNGTSRTLYYNSVNLAHQVGAVTLLKFK